MVEETTYEALFASSTKGYCTPDYNDTTRPLVVRGIIKRKYINAAQRINRDFYYMDTGYFGNFLSIGNPGGKKIWHRVVKNELQKSIIEDFPRDRWENLVRSDPRLGWKGWKTGGSKILLVLPNPKSCHFFNYDYNEWLTSTVNKIKSFTDREIVTRLKGSRGDRNTYSIYDALNNDIYATVTFNSIAAMESIAYGIPSFVTVPCAAYNLAEKDLSKIETPFYPNEKLIQRHCYSLAYGQFLQEEIANGTAWNILKGNI